MLIEGVIIPAKGEICSPKTFSYINSSAHNKSLFDLASSLWFDKDVASGSYPHCKRGYVIDYGENIYEKTETRHERQSI